MESFLTVLELLPQISISKILKLHLDTSRIIIQSSQFFVQINKHPKVMNKQLTLP